MARNGVRNPMSRGPVPNRFCYRRKSRHYLQLLATDDLTGPRCEGYCRMIELSPARRDSTPDEVGTVGALLMAADALTSPAVTSVIDGGSSRPTSTASSPPADVRRPRSANAGLAARWCTASKELADFGVSPNRGRSRDDVPSLIAGDGRDQKFSSVDPVSRTRPPSVRRRAGLRTRGAVQSRL